MYEILKYTDEVDKSLGLAGMAIALMACNGERCISSISVEDGEDSFSFAPEAFFASNPRYSAKLAWSQLLDEVHIFSGMLMGNVFCRHLAASRDLRQEIVDVVHSLIAEHGAEKCDLDNDELEILFNKDIRYFHRLFNYPAVAEAARDFAGTLRIQRRMTAGEAFDYLGRLISL